MPLHNSWLVPASQPFDVAAIELEFRVYTAAHPPRRAHQLGFPYSFVNAGAHQASIPVPCWALDNARLRHPCGEAYCEDQGFHSRTATKNPVNLVRSEDER